MTSRRPAAPSGTACESWRKLAVALAFAVLLGPLGGARAEAADPPTTQESGIEHGAVAEGHTAEEHHDESPVAFAGRLFNFAVLAGVLVYFLRKPIGDYLTGRSGQIRGDLETAAAMEATAERQIAEIEARLQQLPAELEALRARGAQEIAAEEARIRADAEAERGRLLDQTRREIDLQLRLARRDLVTHAAELAVGVARERISRQITEADQQRLVDRYLASVKDNA